MQILCGSVLFYTPFRGSNAPISQILMSVMIQCLLNRDTPHAPQVRA